MVEQRREGGREGGREAGRGREREEERRRNVCVCVYWWKGRIRKLKGRTPPHCIHNAGEKQQQQQKEESDEQNKGQRSVSGSVSE